jgi:hypothetical protein
MVSLGSIVRDYGAAYKLQYSPPPLHLKVLDAVAACRTSALGGHAKACTTCGAIKVYYDSCCNRHCPGCQAFKKEKWVEDRKKELLPVAYLHVVFTLPHELNPLVLSNDRLIYSLLFKAVNQTIKQLGADPKWLGAQTGMIAVLHTWGSTLTLHPHIHCIIPAGGLSFDGKKWKSTKKKHYLAPNKTVIAPIFRGKFMSLLTTAFDLGQLQFFGAAKIYEDFKELHKLFTTISTKKWNVHAKTSFGGPEQIINYLSRYTHRIAISNHRILDIKNGRVSFTYKNYKAVKTKNCPAPIETTSLDVLEFIRRFLMHVVPKGFQRIRYYGFLATVNRKTKLEHIKKLLNFNGPNIQPINWQQRLIQLTGIDPDCCSFCNSKTLQFIGYVPPQTLTGRGPPQIIIIPPLK